MRKHKKLSSDFLVPSTGFIVGAGSLMNISGKYFMFNYSHSDSEADGKAIKSDWKNIGQDIENAMEDISTTKKSNLLETVNG